jgi:hypothetical protein
LLPSEPVQQQLEPVQQQLEPVQQQLGPAQQQLGPAQLDWLVRRLRALSHHLPKEKM